MKQGTVKSHLLEQAEAHAKDCTAFEESLKQQRDCQDVVLQIILLAMMNKDVVHFLLIITPMLMCCTFVYKTLKQIIKINKSQYIRNV